MAGVGAGDADVALALGRLRAVAAGAPTLSGRTRSGWTCSPSRTGR